MIPVIALAPITAAASFSRMSVAELKVQAAALSFEELSDLARHVRTLALRKDPSRQTQLRGAQESKDWLTSGEFEKALAELERNGR